MKLRYNFLIISIIIVIITTGYYIYHYLGTTQNNNNKEESISPYLIKTGSPIDDYLLINKSLYFSQGNTLTTYDIEKRLILKETTYKYNNLEFSISEGLLFVCAYDNHLIKAKEEFATEFAFYENNDLELEMSFHKMVRPILCNNNPIFVDNYPNSPERFYKLTEDGLKPSHSTSTFPLDKKISGDNTSDILEIKHNNTRYIINLSEVIVRYSISDTSLILLDQNGYLWAAILN